MRWNRARNRYLAGNGHRYNADASVEFHSIFQIIDKYILLLTNRTGGMMIMFEVTGYEIGSGFSAVALESGFEGANPNPSHDEEFRINE